MTEPISVRDLELQYEQQKAEYQQTQNKVNRLDATKDLNVKEFNTLYNKLSPTIKKAYSLTLDKPPEEMTLEELTSMKDKVTDAYNDIASKLQSYLRTGKIDTISTLLPKDESNNALTETLKTESVQLESLVEQQSEKVETVTEQAVNPSLDTGLDALRY